MKTCPCNIQRFFFQKKKKMKISLENFFDFLNISTQNILCGYTLELPRYLPQRGGSNEYPQCMFWSKNRYTPANPIFTI